MVVTRRSWWWVLLGFSFSSSSDPWLGNMSTFVWRIMGNHKLDESEINSGSFTGTWDSTLSCQPHNKCTLFVFWHIHMANDDDDKRGNDPTPRSSSPPHHHPINKIYISVTFSSVAYLWPHLVHTDLASVLQLMCDVGSSSPRQTPSHRQRRDGCDFYSFP